MGKTSKKKGKSSRRRNRGMSWAEQKAAAAQRELVAFKADAARLAAYPVAGAFVTGDWQKAIETAVIVVRKRPDDDWAVAFFMVDLGARGVRDCFLRKKMTELQLQRMREGYEELHRCDPALARKIVESAYEWAASFQLSQHPHAAPLMAFFGDDIDPESSDVEVEVGHEDKPVLYGTDAEVEALAQDLIERYGEGSFFIFDGEEPVEVEAVEEEGGEEEGGDDEDGDEARDADAVG